MKEKYAKQLAQDEVITKLRKAIGKGFTVSADMLETPPNVKLGDIAFPCFELAKGEKRNPVEIATELAAKIGPGKMVSKISSAGPYVNFTFDLNYFGETVLGNIKLHGAKYGESVLGNGTKIIVDYAQPNTHKEFHVGHVRNALLGQSIINVLRATGYEVVAASYIGDVGAHVAKALWGLKKFHDGEEFEHDERASRLGQIYTEASAYVEDHPEAKEEIAEVQRKIESGDEEWVDLWKETREWSLELFREIFEELGVDPDVWYFESQVEKPGKELVKKLLTSGVAKKSEGATIIDLENEGLGVFLILKSDGSSLYATKDLALAIKKDKDFGADRQLFVVDVRQSLHFKQLFAAMKHAGFTKQLTHIDYDMVNLPEGTMASRSGNVVTYEDLRDEMIGELIMETQKRHEDWSDKKIRETARKIALASISFIMLRQDPGSIITFDKKEALSFDGFTAPYILYTIARIESIKKKAKIKPRINLSVLTSAEEYALIRQLADYPLLIMRVATNYQVSAIAAWAFDTAKMFSEYYHDVHIIDENDKIVTAARLALVDSVRQVLENAMDLLTIDVVKEM
ncbi:MAG: arginine--tRNA ligase [Candidatus Uhrbacteria bacterium]|nr:arginine--tRNA ligase [Candidatus Uhrbacteria bacterium]